MRRTSTHIKSFSEDNIDLYYYANTASIMRLQFERFVLERRGEFFRDYSFVSFNKVIADTDCLLFIDYFPQDQFVIDTSITSFLTKFCGKDQPIFKLKGQTELNLVKGLISTFKSLEDFGVVTLIQYVVNPSQDNGIFN